ncbi:MAG: Crp/Fnr family transcriptional regulator [Acidobacteria bacterium]|nr:Crp/Fnr family transcriptional regulator [Acidobacteriota bacterium]
MPHVLEHSHENSILVALPNAEAEHLRSQLEPVRFRPQRVIYEVGDPIRYVYFPTCGALSLLSSTEAGTSVEVGVVGTEGMAGIPLILGVNQMLYRVTSQLTADVLRLSATALLEVLRRSPRLHELLHLYLYTMLRQTTQVAICHRFHTTEERFCRWLLTARDCSDENSFPLTQESIAQTLGVPRTSVTMIAGRLQQLNLISYSRGKVTILDRKRLSKAACECYDVITEENNHFRRAARVAHAPL